MATYYWVRLYVYPVGERWAAVIVAADVAPPGPDEVKANGFYAPTAEEPERLVKTHLAQSEPLS